MVEKGRGFRAKPPRKLCKTTSFACAVYVTKDPFSFTIVLEIRSPHFSFFLHENKIAQICRKLG